MTATAAGPDYLRPTSLAEAFRIVREIPGARFVAGATDVMVQMQAGRAPLPPALVSLRSIPELRGIECGEQIRIGALTTVRDLVDHSELADALPALAEAANVFAGPQIRNVATVGGNLCNAAPCADLAPPLLVHDAVVQILGAEGAREVALDGFFAGPGSTCLAEGELVTAIRVSRPAPGTRSTFRRKVRVAMDLTLASVAVAMRDDGGTCRGVRVAAGSVAPTPLRLRDVERSLEGCQSDDAAVRRAGDIAAAEIRPITDLRTTAEYRRHITAVFVRRAVARLAQGAS